MTTTAKILTKRQLLTDFKRDVIPDMSKFFVRVYC